MTETYSISGKAPSGGVFSMIGRAVFLAAATIGGLFMLFFSAALVFFVVAAVVVIGCLAFAFLRLKAKLSGKPFGPRAQFEQMRQDLEGQMQGDSPSSKMSAKDAEAGPVVDAHRTPDGWSVDD